MELKKTKAKFKKSVFGFVDMLATRKVIEQRPINVENTPLAPIKTNYHVNEIVQQIHPKSQLLKISQIVDLSKTVKMIRFVPADENKKVALFRPGQYLNITFDIDNKPISRPYSIASSLNDAFEHNYYDVAIKYNVDGFVSKHVHLNLKVGDIVKANAPDGEFFYSKIRDSQNIIALVGGIGITPIYSITKWICESKLDIKITILYSNINEGEMVYAQEIENLAANNSNVKIHHFITKQPDTKHHNRRIDFSDIQKIDGYQNATYMLCGPKRFVKGFEEELLKQRISRKQIRLESSSELKSPIHNPDYLNVGGKEEYHITVHYRDEIYNIVGSAHETVFSALQRANLPIKSSCLSGKCSMCRVRLINGEVFTPKASACYRQSDYINKIIYTCSVYPVTDLEIDML